MAKRKLTNDVLKDRILRGNNHPRMQMPKASRGPQPRTSPDSDDREPMGKPPLRIQSKEVQLEQGGLKAVIPFASGKLTLHVDPEKEQVKYILKGVFGSNLPLTAPSVILNGGLGETVELKRTGMGVFEGVAGVVALQQEGGKTVAGGDPPVVSSVESYIRGTGPLPTFYVGATLEKPKDTLATRSQAKGIGKGQPIGASKRKGRGRASPYSERPVSQKSLDSGKR